MRTRLLSMLLLAGCLLLPVRAVRAGEDPNRIQNLDELAMRTGEKPYHLLEKNGLYPSERTIFNDVRTGAEVWRITSDPGEDSHVYYDVQPYNADGSVMVVNYAARIGSREWLVAADGSWMRPMRAEGERLVSTHWSWLDPNRIYAVENGIVCRYDWRTQQTTTLCDLSGPTGIPARMFQLQVPHPADDRLLFRTREAGRFFILSADGKELHEIPTDGRWKVRDGIHRIRWSKSADHSIFLGQNYYLDESGEAQRTLIQYIADKDGNLTYSNLDHVTERRAGHPDCTPDGLFLTGTYSGGAEFPQIPSGSIWIHPVDNPSAARCFFNIPLGHHSSNTWDNRWHITDNRRSSRGPYLLRGLNMDSSNVLISLDGRAQVVLNYHYSSYGSPQSVHPHPATSPDGNKVIYNSNMLRRAPREEAGNSDVWVAVIRRPFPPELVSAAVRGGTVTLSWTRPAHADPPLHWNPGNRSREVKGYLIRRAERSGGPYDLIHDGVITAETYTDTGTEAGKTYYYVVQSVEHTGLISVFSAEACAGSPGPIRHFYEAEFGDAALPMVPQMDWQGTSGGWYVGTFARVPDPRYPLEPYPATVTFPVDVPKAGRFSLTCRVAAFEGPGRFTVTVDGNAVGEVTATGPEWSWGRIPGNISLTAGPHIVRVSTMDESLGFDILCLTDDLDFRPAGFGSWDTVPPPTPTGLAVRTLDGRTKRITWTASDARDVRYYNVYCGRDAGFAPDNHRLIASPTSTAFLDWGIPEGVNTVYKVTAVDYYGNESAPAVFQK